MRMNRPRASTTMNLGYQVRSFLVRLWQRPDGFKAEVRILSSGENKTFESPEALFRYLREQAEMKPEPGDDGR